MQLLEACPEITVRELVVCFLHGSCIAHYKGSFILKVSATSSSAKQLLKESHGGKHQQKPRCLWMTLNEKNTVMVYFPGLLLFELQLCNYSCWRQECWMHIKYIIPFCRVFPAQTLSQRMWGRYCRKVVKVAIPFLITPGRLRVVTDEILQIQRDNTLPSLDGLSCPSARDYCAQGRAGRREPLNCTAWHPISDLPSQAV